MYCGLFKAPVPRTAQVTLSGSAMLGLLAVLAGCAVNDPMHSDQALGRALSLNAWLDPAVEPLTGCAALNGEWRNRGSLVRNRGVKSSVLAAAIGLAEEQPEATFAESLRLARTVDGSLDLTALAAGRETATVRIPAAAINCNDPTVAVLNYQGIKRVTVDASGALWVEEHRYPRDATAACSVVDQWTLAAPDGMAAVIPGGYVLLWNAAAGEIAQVEQPGTGVDVPVDTSFWLPGEQSLAARVTFKAESQWALRLDSAVAEVTGSLEACHVYTLYGHSSTPDQASLSLFDLGTDFAWRSCALVPTEDGRGPVFDGRDLLVSELCFARSQGNWDERSKLPRRRLSPLNQVDLRREVAP